ncbi:MAG: hypothetical protein IJ204_04850 [Paludibacteraceae bacterium]|nr:hypothetical protein [Paludibacteraceae bacterium]
MRRLAVALSALGEGLPLAFGKWIANKRYRSAKSQVRPLPPLFGPQTACGLVYAPRRV